MDIERRRFLRLLSLGTLGFGFAGLAGCGGGNAPDGTGNNGGGGLGGDPNALSSDALFAAQTAITDFTNALAPADMAVQQQQVIDFLRGRSEVAEAGPCDDGAGAWAIFKNGWAHFVILNRGRSSVEDDPGAGRAAGTGVPKAGPAVLINAMGPGYPDEAARIVPALNAAGGYAVTRAGADLNSLRNIGTPSFLFLSAHGNSATLRGVPLFVLSTGTTLTPALVAAANAEANALFVVSASVAVNFQANGQPINATVFGITQRWVARYWKFAPSSLVWLSACGSQSAAGQLLVQACLGAGAGAVAGYTDTVESQDSDRVQRFVIDRLVGANVLAPKEATPQRAFDYDKVLADMTQKIGNAFPVKNPSTGTAIPGRTVSLKITKGADNFGLLAPSIAYVLIDEAHEQAILKGTFGLETDGKVFIDGAEQTVESWGTDEIKVQLPRSGTGSAGDVQVVVRDHKSNVRRITRYTIDGTFRFHGDAAKPQKIEGGMTLQFRMDVGEYRKDPGNVFIRPTRTASATHNSKAELSATGVQLEPCGTGGTSSVEWLGDGTLVPFDDNHPLTGLGLVSWLKVDTIDKAVALSIIFGVTAPDASPFTVRVKDCDGQTITTPLVPAPPVPIDNIVEFPNPADPDNFPPLPFLAFEFAMSGDWGIPGAKMENDIASFEWVAARVEFAPDPKAARGTAVKTTR